MQITINIPFKKYVFLIKKFFKKIQVKRFANKHKIKFTPDEIEGLGSSLVSFPEFDLNKIIIGYSNNRKN